MSADPMGTFVAAPAPPGLYVYCIARGDASRILGAIGLDAANVYTVSDGKLCAVVHDCRAKPYESKDPQVLQAWAVTHQQVVTEAGKAIGAVLPMAFDMIVRSGQCGGPADELRGWLTEKRDRFTRLLDRVEGKAEYGVQIFWDPQAVAARLIESDPELRRLQEEAVGKPKGMAHLLQTKLAKAIREAAERHADSTAQDFYARIRRRVDDVRVDPLRKLEGAGRMLLNLSCLMPAGDARLGQELEEMCKDPGISVRFTGPWPPYSFVGG